MIKKTHEYDTTDTSEYQQVISCQKLEICLRTAFANQQAGSYSNG
jgi:hypothetical protein